MANSLTKHYSKTLSNGLQVYVVPMDNSSGVISTDIFYKVGSRDEILGKTGIAHMLEHMNFKSTKNLPEGEFDRIVKSHGGVNNASTGFDYTHYFIKSSSDNLDISLELYAELMQNLNLTDEEFQKERDVVAEERRWRTDNNPIGYLYFRLFNTHYVSHSYHWTPIGFMEDILSWNIEDIREFHTRFYRPDNAIIIVSGDIESETVFGRVQNYFEAIPNNEPENTCSLVATNIPQEPPRDSNTRVILHKENSEVDTIAITYSIPNYRHEDQVALSVISELLSAGQSSRLQQKLVNTRLASQVYGYNMELTDEGVFLFLAVANPDIEAEELENVILKEIEKIKSELVTQEEIEKIKINAKRDFIHTLESSSSLSDMYGGYLIRGDLDPLLNYEENLDKISANTIRDVANRYFDNNKATTAILRKNNE
ncbi:MAG: insulinase family protein [Sulfurovum sp.]|nr:insulinase family protein [Sulfurovum sp.]